MQVLQRNEVLDKRVTMGAYQQAIKFHLVLICEAFKQEIASDNNLSVQKQQSFSQLSQRLAQKEIHCQYCSLLSDLEENSNSWLHNLLNNYDACFEKPSIGDAGRRFEARNKNEDSGSVAGLQSIAFKNLTDLSVEQQFQHDLEQLLDIIKQYRNLMQEW
jgi:hypothetical protein